MQKPNRYGTLSLSLSHSPIIERLKKRRAETSYSKQASHGFTIVELLVVIVVIGILAAITIVSYTGITQRAVSSSLQSDLTNASQQLKLYNQLYSSYPTAMTGNCPTAPNSDSNYCLKASSGNSFVYTSNGTTFSLTETNTNNTAYGINDTSSVVALAAPTDCPTGFVSVPGSATYGQAGFCTMKYAASQVGSSNVPTSVPSVQPWVNISQTTAIADAPNVAGCTGCHLITESEWMTISQNVLSVASNWSGGSVGNGYIYSGHNDNAPANALAPSSSDASGYSGETNTGGNQRRTLILSNGQVIWDLAGNVWQWTAGTVAGGQPGVVGNNYSAWIDWPNVTTKGNLTVNPFPSGTGLAGSSTWNNGNGVGMLISSTTDNGLYGFIRGGYWNNGGIDGVLALALNNGPGAAISSLGFRVSR